MKLRKNAHAKDYQKKLLSDCKSWLGPCTSMDELMKVIRNNGDRSEFIVKTELAYYIHSHKADRFQHPELFKINGLTNEDKLENLLVLLSDENENSSATIANLPSNKDILTALEKLDLAVPDQTGDDDDDNINVNEMRVVCWNVGNEQYVWYLGYIKEKRDNSFIIDHLTRDIKSSNRLWKYPFVEDVQVAERDQILDINVDGYSDFTDTRHNKYILQNEKAIKFKFEAICL